MASHSSASKFGSRSVRRTIGKPQSAILGGSAMPQPNQKNHWQTPICYTKEVQQCHSPIRRIIDKPQSAILRRSSNATAQSVAFQVALPGIVVILLVKLSIIGLHLIHPDRSISSTPTVCTWSIPTVCSSSTPTVCSSSTPTVCTSSTPTVVSHPPRPYAPHSPNRMHLPTPTVCIYIQDDNDPILLYESMPIMSSSCSSALRGLPPPPTHLTAHVSPSSQP